VCYRPGARGGRGASGGGQLQLAAQGGREPLQGRLGRVAGTAFDPADVSLRNARQVGELTLGKTPGLTGVVVLEAKSDARLEPLAQFSCAGRLGGLTGSGPPTRTRYRSTSTGVRASRGRSG
jgi:hypothetical protein